MKRVLFFLSLLLLCFIFNSCTSEDENQKTESSVLPNTIIQHEPIVIIDETVKVNAGTYLHWTIPLKVNDLLHCEINSDTDINVWFMSKREFESYERNEVFNIYTGASRKETLRFSFDFTVPEDGDYYLVLDNKSSWFTSKNVSVKATWNH